MIHLISVQYSIVICTCISQFVING